MYLKLFTPFWMLIRDSTLSVMFEIKWRTCLVGIQHCKLLAGALSWLALFGVLLLLTLLLTPLVPILLFRLRLGNQCFTWYSIKYGLDFWLASSIANYSRMLYLGLLYLGLVDFYYLPNYLRHLSSFCCFAILAVLFV